MAIKKNEFITRLASKGYTKKDAEIITDDVLSTITEILEKGGSVMFHGFGTFSVADRKDRQGISFDGSEILIPGYPHPKFSAGKNLKRIVREGNASKE